MEVTTDPLLPAEEDMGLSPDRSTFTTYRMADGSLVYGEFTFVTELDFFDNLDSPVKVVKETWKLDHRETVTFQPYGWDDEDDEDPDLTGTP